MKTKSLLFMLSTAFCSFMNAQFTSGSTPVTLGSTGMTLKMETTATQVTITLTGSSTSYLALNFVTSGNGMDQNSDGFIYNSTASRDYTYQGIGVPPTADSGQDWNVTSDTTSGGIRTLVATRSLSGGAGDFAFSNTSGSKTVAFARGGSTTIAQHSSSNRGYATLNMISYLGVNDVEAAKKFLVQQNPVKDNFELQNAQDIASFSIYDLHGRLIAEEKEVSTKEDATFLKTGVYFMEIKTKEGQTFYEKIIKE